jgi:hypothetical protein
VCPAHPRLIQGPAGVERTAGTVELDDQRCVIRGQGSSLPGLAIDVGVNGKNHCLLSLRGGRSLTCYFLKRSFKARRGSSGHPDAADVSRSTVARREKNVQSLRARLSAMRSGTGWVHSNRWPGAKWVHCWQACSSARHLGHWPSPSVNEGRSVPQSVQRKTVRLGGIPGARVPDGLSSFPPPFFLDSRYPR